jgi:hypothetical protein
VRVFSSDRMGGLAMNLVAASPGPCLRRSHEAQPGALPGASDARAVSQPTGWVVPVTGSMGCAATNL